MKIKIISSSGTILTNKDGTITTVQGNVSFISTYKDCVKVMFEEHNRYWRKPRGTRENEYDILNVAFKDKKGKIIPADKDWRAGTKNNLINDGINPYDRHEKLTKVRSRDGKEAGYVIPGMESICRMEGCRGHRVTVQWPDGKRTKPCTHGIKMTSKRLWRIM